MAGKQIEFPEKQTHLKSYERNIWILMGICIVFVLIAINVVGSAGSYTP
jgi:hypothetical protein